MCFDWQVLTGCHVLVLYHSATEQKAFASPQTPSELVQRFSECSESHLAKLLAQQVGMAQLVAQRVVVSETAVRTWLI